jgi:hypothetical protein
MSVLSKHSINYKFDSTTVMPVTRAIQLEPRLSEGLTSLNMKRDSARAMRVEVGELYKVGDFWELYPTLPGRAPLVFIDLPACAQGELPMLLESNFEIVAEVHQMHDGEGPDVGCENGAEFEMYLTMSSKTRSLQISTCLLPSYEIQGHRQVTLLIRTGGLLWSRPMTENTLVSADALDC